MNGQLPAALLTVAPSVASDAFHDGGKARERGRAPYAYAASGWPPCRCGRDIGTIGYRIDRAGVVCYACAVRSGS